MYEIQDKKHLHIIKAFLCRIVKINKIGNVRIT